MLLYRLFLQTARYYLSNSQLGMLGVKIMSKLMGLGLLEYLTVLLQAQ